MTSSGERFAQISLFFWILAAVKSAGGQSVTWHEPLPAKTVSSANDVLTPAETKVFEGYPASLSWNYSLTSVTFFSATIKFNTDILVTSGPGGEAAQVVDAFKDEFNFTWISQRLTLVIFNMTAAYDESNGAFSSEFVGTGGTWVRKIRVKIIEHTKIVDETSDIDVCEDTKVTLSCNATGKPDPNITWTRVWENGTDSGALQSKDGYFVMDNIDRSSNGTYRCTAFNGVRDPVNQTVEVTVRYSVIRVVGSSNAVLEGDAYTLSCEATGDPMPNVTWIKVSSNERKDGKILNFTNIDRNDAGDYKCEANNICGTKTKTEAINVSYPSKVTRSMNDTMVNDTDEVTLDCQADGYPFPTIRWIFVSNNSFVPRTFRITGKQDEGFYRCIADNGVGNPSTREVYITVLHYRPLNTTLTINTGNSSVVLNKTFTVRCDAPANPPARYEILRDDGTIVGTNSAVETSVTEGIETNTVDFTCKPFNAYGKGPTVTIPVEVFTPSAITNKSSCQIYVKTGNMAVLACIPTGHPTPTITWTLKGTVLETEGYTINITPQKTGVYNYTCKAENGIEDPSEWTFKVVVEDQVALLLRYRMTYPEEEFTDELNNDGSDKYRKLTEEVQKVKEAFPECHTPKRVNVERFSPNLERQVVVFFGLFFNLTMGEEASTSYLKDAAKEGKLGDVDADSVTFLEAIIDRKRCMALYNDDQLCENVKDVWIAVFSVGGLTVAAVIGLVAYHVHKKRKCRRKDNSVHNGNEEEQAFSSNHSTLSDGKSCDYARSGPQPSVDLEMGAVPICAVVDKSRKEDKKKNKKAAEQKPADDQYAVVNNSKKTKKNETDNTYAEVDMSKKSKKKPKSGEVLYADLDEFHQIPEVSTSPKALPSINRPEAYAETQYADITQFLNGNPEDTGAELPKHSSTPGVSDTAIGSKEESSAGNTGDSAEATNETGF